LIRKKWILKAFAGDHMKAIILAAGKGTRLRPLTLGIPKPLLPIKGKPIIDWVIRNVKSREVNEIIIAVGGGVGEDFQERIISHTHGICIDSYMKNMNYGCKIRTIPTPQRETGGDLKYVLEEIGLKKGELIVAYGDNLTVVDIKKMIEYHRKCRKTLGTAATVLLFEVPEKDVNRFGIAKIQEKSGFNLIEKFVEKPRLKEAPSRFANAGYYILDLEEVFDILPMEKVKMENSVFPKLAKEGKLAGFIAKLPFWMDIGTVEAYEEASRLAHENLIIPPSVGE